VLIPIGGTEQNGPHMVLGKHNVRAKALCGKIAQALGNALVAPVIAYVPEGGVSPPSSHMRFAGTISITPQTFERLLEDAARSFRATGFRDVVFVGDHGGYQRSEQAVAARLDREWAKTPARAHALVDYYAAVETEYPAALAARGYSKAEIGTHAGLADTSLALAVDPALVRKDILAAGQRLDASNGVYGDPRRSTAELGQIGVDAIVKRSVEAIRRVTQR
jgi:creatinine amidohydrolase/Fe(II)-dependent formamide hydrolase-like protein